MFNANNLNKNVYFQITPARINVLCEVISRKELLGKVEFFSLIFRRNIIAQAISYHNAIRTGLWHSNHSSQSDTEKEFDPLEVLKWICNISAMEGEALSFVRDRRVLMIFYEDLISAPFETLSLFLGYHNFEFESSRLSEILVGDSGPRKISRSGYDEDYQRLINQFPWLRDILATRLAGYLATDSIRDIIFKNCPEAVE